MAVRPKKSLGQHFLNDLDIARRIADTLSPDTLPEGARKWGSLPILEVGPGTGVLTQFLLQTGRPLKAVELDTESVGYLKKAYPHLDVVEDDFLRLDIGKLFEGEFVLTGNYPYNISSQIFFRLLDFRERIPVCSGMLQREVAQRLCSPPGSKVYGILSVFLQAWYDCEYLFTVDENVFTPPPKVKSGVIRLVRNSRTSLGCDERRFRTVVKTAFGQRRKTLRNSLATLLPPKGEILSSPLLKERPERLGVEEFVELTRMLTPGEGK